MTARSLGALRQLHERNVATDPFVQFRVWWEEARATGHRWADAMVLATVSPEGVPSGRAVILRGLDERGFLFFTDTRSAKAVDLATNPRVALVFLWPDPERQVRVVGRVTAAPDDETNRFFAGRPREANVAATLAVQGEVLPGPDELERRRREMTARVEGQHVGRPPHWGGYIVSPDEFEFWQGRPDYLHDRLRYRRDPGGWFIERLAP